MCHWGTRPDSQRSPQPRPKIDLDGLPVRGFMVTRDTISTLRSGPTVGSNVRNMHGMREKPQINRPICHLLDGV